VWYDATYATFGAMATGRSKVAVCHPELLSPLKTTDASFARDADQSVPTCWPVFAVLL
jgi:hypothetical protein